MKSNEIQHRINLVNIQSSGTRCGFGSGKTREIAIAEALKIARQKDPNAYFNGAYVLFDSGTPAL